MEIEANQANIDWLNRLNLRGEKLSKSHRIIMSYIVDNHEKAIFMTANALAKQCEISESTVVRFANAMGYDGYTELQEAIRNAAKKRLTAQQRVSILSEIEESQVLSAVLKNDINNIKQTTELLDTTAFENAVTALLGARRVCVMGLRSAAPLAQFMHHYLCHILEHVSLVQNTMSDVFEDLSKFGKDDVLFAISFPRYSKTTSDGIRFATQNGSTVIALTDSPLSPLHDASDVCLCAATDMTSFVDSLAAPLSVINALIVRLGIAKKEALSAHFQKMEEIWNANGVYIDRDDE